MVSLFILPVENHPVAQVSLVPVLVHVPVHDDLFANVVSTLDQVDIQFPVSNLIRVLVYVNVYRFAVNAYGLPANV